MPRTRTIRRNSTKTKKRNNNENTVPEIVQSFVARRLVDGVSIVFFALGVFILGSLLSYSPLDPSMNSAGQLEAGQLVLNWFGESGAWVSDMLVQSIGAGSYILGLGSMIWSARMIKRHSLHGFGLRFLALSASAVLGCLMFAQFQSDWATHGYLGGAFGTVVLNKVSISLMGHDFVMAFLLPAVFCVLSIAVFLFAVAVTRDEFLYAANVLRYAALTSASYLINSYIRFKNWIYRYNNAQYQPEPLMNLSMPRIDLPVLQKKSSHASVSVKKKVNDIPADNVKSEKPVPREAEADLKNKTSNELSSIPVVKPLATETKGASISLQQSQLHLDATEWELPSVNLLSAIPDHYEEDQLNEDALRRNAQLLQTVLADFKIEGEIVSIHPGPVVTLYELEPSPGTKSARVISLSDDIARSMSAISVRCAVVPGRNVIGIEIPNKSRQVVYMQELLTSRLFEKSKQHLPLILGKDIGGQPIMADLAKMPHLLVAGTTGSGKSVAVNTMILSLLYRLPPEKCRMIMIDPKMLELSVYDDIPHLLSPVVTEAGKAVVALKWTVQEMENRYRSMSKLGVRNIEGYNMRMREAKEKGEELTMRVATGFDETGAPTHEERPMDMSEIPYIVVVVDEFADLMLVAGKDVENAIQRLAQKARAAGIHLIMATQRPSVDVITGVVKANFPTRISFQVTSKIDSRTILGEGGAEQLLGMGDMLYMAPGGRITRVHGPFVSDDDVENAVNFLKKQGKPAYLDDITNEEGNFGGSEVMDAMFGDGGSGSAGNDVDELYDQAVAIVAREGKASTSFIQRHLQIGYNRAARIMEEMERQGVVSPATATGKRTVFAQDFSDV